MVLEKLAKLFRCAPGDVEEELRSNEGRARSVVTRRRFMGVAAAIAGAVVLPKVIVEVHGRIARPSLESINDLLKRTYATSNGADYAFMNPKDFERLRVELEQRATRIVPGHAGYSGIDVNGMKLIADIHCPPGAVIPMPKFKGIDRLMYPDNPLLAMVTK